MRKVRIDSLSKAQYDPPASALEFWRQAQDKRKKEILESGKKLKGLPGNPYSQKEADAIAKEQEALRQRAYYKQFSERPQAVESTLGPVEGAIALAAGAPALASTLGTELLGTGVTLGNLANTGFATHGVYNFANPESDFRQALSRYNQGEGDWRDVAFEGGLNALNFLGAASLPGDIKALSNARAPQYLGQINLRRGAPKPPKSKILNKVRHTEDPNFIIREVFKGDLVNPKKINIKGQTGYLQANKAADGTYYFNAVMTSPFESGKAMLKMDELLPPKPTILEPNSLSLDSYLNTIKLGKRPHWNTQFENYIPLNHSAIHNTILSDKFGIVPDGYTMVFNSLEEANAALKDVNTWLKKQGITHEADVIGNGNGLFGIKVPNFRLSRDYKEGGSLPKAQDGNPPSLFKYTEDNDDISMPWWDAPKENVGQGSSKQNEVSNIEKIIQDQLRKDIRKAPRSEQIRYAVNQLKYMDPNYSPNLETLMNMTAWMENDYGTNPDAYGRDYTNSFMSLDDPAIDAIYIPRGQNTYNRSQRNVLDNLKKYGYTNRDALVKALRNEDPIAAMLAARATYYLSPDPLPDMSNPEAVFKYFAKNYNHYGYRKHKSDEEAYAKFLKGWEKYGKKSNTSKSKMAKGGELPKAQFGYETFLDKEKNGPWEQNDPYLHNFSTVDVPENLSELPSYRAYTFAKGDLHPMTAFGHATSYDSGYTKFDNKTGYLYQPNTENLQDFQSLPMEGDREFNLRRFVLNPYEGQQQTHDVYTRRDASGNIINDKENFIPKSYSKEETMDNVFKDLYGQNLYKFKGDRDAAYNATKEFMKNRVEPQYKGKYYEFMNNPDISFRDKKNISSSSKMTVYDDSAKDQLYQSFVDELYNPPFNPIASPSVKEALSPDPSKISKAVYENPKFKEKLDLYNDVLQDWYITNKHMTPEQAKSQVEGNLYKDTPWDKQKKQGGSVKKVKIKSIPKNWKSQ